MHNDNILKKTVAFVSLGCDKNRVDLERVLAQITNAGFIIESNIYNANIVIVNTCSFIKLAREESIDNILNIAQLKNENCEKFIVTGCLNEMNYTDLQASLPEVDLFVRVADNNKIVDHIYHLYNAPVIKIDNYCYFNRVITTPIHYAFLKISEGCDNFCSYCTIPYIRGRFKSMPLDDLVAEVKHLASMGVKEIILVGQDVTKYGIDLYNKYSLVKLIKEISKIENIKWIRLLYCYPELVSDELINEIKHNDKVVKYIDLPIQHVNNNVLKLMNRKTTKQNILQIINKLKSEVKNIAIRSTFILGFPGESDDDFNEVLAFIESQKLTNVGFFAYSKEEGTQAFGLKHQISDNVKHSRVKKAYKAQKKVVENFNNNLLEQILDVIIDKIEQDCFVGRAYFSAPEVDTVVYIPINSVSSKINVGDIISIKIKKVLGYDLEGEVYELAK